MDPEQLAKEYLALSQEQRELFLRAIDADPATPWTWYVYPDHDLPNSVTPNDGT